MSFQSKRIAVPSGTAPNDADYAYLVRAEPKTFYRRHGKRLLDLAIVALIAIPVGLVVAVFAALVAMDGKSPVFRQVRVGKGGKEFGMWKLRSMVCDAEARLEDYLAGNPDARKEWNSLQKLKKDPRITPIGKLIRRTSIDELPQVFNVLMGHMSLVGPRPMLPSQKDLYPGIAYYMLRPGMTGFWQVSERNGSEFSRRAYHDTQYNNKVSLSTDIDVMMKTVKCVTGGSGY